MKEHQDRVCVWGNLWGPPFPHLGNTEASLTEVRRLDGAVRLENPQASLLSWLGLAKMRNTFYKASWREARWGLCWVPRVWSMGRRDWNPP